MTGAITIRGATFEDAQAVRDLTLLDGGEAPQGKILLAFVDGELRAAVGRDDGRVVADPFHLTNDLVELVRMRLAQDRPRRRLRLRPWRGRLAPAMRGEARA